MQTPRPDDLTTAVVRDEVWQAAGKEFIDEQWDKAIFSASRAVEAALREHICSTEYGTRLVAEAFDPKGLPKVVLSSEDKDQRGLQSLFGGVLSFYKGMRSHGDQPRVPCPGRHACIRVLAAISVLYDLLDMDPAVVPAITATKTAAEDTIDLLVERAGAAAIPLIDGVPAPVVSRAGHVFSIRFNPHLPFPSSLTVRDGHRLSKPYVITVPPEVPSDDNFHRVLETDVRLYTDDQGQLPLLGVRGIAIESTEGARRFVRYFPSRQPLPTRSYVTWEWDMGRVSGPSWRREGGEIVQAWTSSAFFAGKPLGNESTPALAGIALFPARIATRPRERVPSRVVAFRRDGPATWREDVTDRASLTVEDESVAKADGTALQAVRMGKTVLRATFENRFAEAPVEVAALTSRSVHDYYGGTREVSALAVLGDDLLYSTLSDSIWRISRDGYVSLLSRLAMPRTASHGASLLGVLRDGRVLVRTMWDNGVLMLVPDDGYTTTRALGPLRFPDASVMCFCEAAGQWFFGLSNGSLVVSADLQTFNVLARLPVAAVSIAPHQGALYVVSGGGGPGYVRVDPHTGAFQLQDWLAEDLSSPAAVAAEGDYLLVADFGKGQIFRISDLTKTIETLADGFANPTALAVRRDGAVFVADLSTDVVRLILP